MSAALEQATPKRHIQNQIREDVWSQFVEALETTSLKELYRQPNMPGRKRFRRKCREDRSFAAQVAVTLRARKKKRIEESYAQTKRALTRKRPAKRTAAATFEITLSRDQLYAAVSAAVPKSLPPITRDDIICDMMLAVLEGQIEVGQIKASAVVPQTNDDPEFIGVAETDAEAEATIDLLEEAAILAVTNADTPQAALIRKAVLRRATELKSIRFASADSGSKLALRAVALTCHLKIDQPTATCVPTGLFAALPAPLRAVAASLAPTSAGYATCTAIAARLTPPTAPIFLGGADLTIVPTALGAGAVPAQGLADPFAPDPLGASFDIPGTRP